MRYIQKGPEPQELIDHKNLEDENWHPTFRDLPRDVKQAIYRSLIEEQMHICCYCERRLENDDYHIDHVKPQHLQDVDPLDYTNMACSCLRHTKPKIPLHCGHAKHNEQIKISPFDELCESRFEYTDDGQILPMDNDIEAQKTIQVLKLNIEKLKSLRSEVLSVYIDSDKDCDVIKHEMELDMKVKDGKLPAFISAIRYHYNAWFN